MNIALKMKKRMNYFDSKRFVWQKSASAIYEHLATGKELLINAEHAMHVLEIMETAHKSQISGKRIELKSTFKWPVVS